jgi:hypothetical protein
MMMKNLLFLLCFCASPLFAQTALQFNGTSQYVTMGAAPGLNASSFTLECWIKKEAGGTYASSGTGGVGCIPIIAKGRSESDYTNLD